MIKRALLLLLALTLLLAAAAGCSPGAKQSAEPDAVEISEPDDDADAESGADVDTEPADAPAALELETDGERAAFSTAQSEESRRWASGNAESGTPVAGDPFLVGYGVLVHDSATQYQVMVLDGEVRGYFGKSAEPRYIEASFQGYNPTIDPASARQTEAFEAAKAEIAAVNPGATQGGIEFYVFFYPSVEEASYPQACIYAEPTLAEFPMAMGGSYGWR